MNIAPCLNAPFQLQIHKVEDTIVKLIENTL